MTTEEKYEAACTQCISIGDMEKLQTLHDVHGIYMDYKNFYQGNEVEWLENAMKERIDFIMAGGDVWDFLV